MLTERITLPEHPDHPGVEQWVDLRAVSTLRAGDRKAVDRAVKYRFDENNEPIREFSSADSDARDDALLTRIIVAWSYSDLPKDPLPVPAADPSSLDDVPLDAEAVLQELLKPYQEYLNFKKGQKTPPSSPDDSSGSRTTSEDTTSPDASPTPSSSPPPSTPGTPPPSDGRPPM